MTARSTDARAGAWLLAWDTREAPAPTLARVAGGGAAGPVVAPLGPSGFALLDGYLFDRAQLGGRPEDEDAGLLVAAWERWGAEALAKLRGAFVVVVWEPEGRRLVVGRDAAGVVPCFLRWDGRRLLVARSLDVLLAQPDVPRRVSPLALAEYLHDLWSPAQVQGTFYEGVDRLPPAHVLTLQDGRLGITRYWDPVPAGFEWARPEEAEQFEPLLRQAVGRCLAAGADSLALSGGVDSIGLATLAAAGRGGRPPLHAVSLRFPDPVCDESATQAAVAQALGMPQTLRAVDEVLGARSLVDVALELSATSPSPVLSPWQAIYVSLLRSAAPLGLRRLVTGTGGDDVLGVDVTWGADCLAALDLAGLWRFHRTWQRSAPAPGLRVARGVLWDAAIRTAVRRQARAALEAVSPAVSRWERRRRLERAVPAWLVPDRAGLGRALVDRHLAAPRRLAPPEGAYVSRLRAQLLAPPFLVELDQGHAWAAQAGVELMLPYFDRDLLDVVLRMHPEHLMAGGRAKSPLRRLVAERLPLDLPSRKMDFGRVFHRMFRPDGARAWSRMGGARRLADLGVVDRAALDGMMARYFTGGVDQLGMRAWLVLGAEIWLRARSGDPSLPQRQEVAS